MSIKVNAVYKVGGIGLVVIGMAEGPLRVIYGKTTTLQGYKIFNAKDDGTSRSCESEIFLKDGEQERVEWNLKNAKYDDIVDGERLFIISENI